MSDADRPSSTPPKRLNKKEAREALPQHLHEVFDKLCEETLYWSQYYYASKFISYSIIKELVEDGWRKEAHAAAHGSRPRGAA